MAAVRTASPANASSQLPNARFEVRIIELLLRHYLEEEVGLLSPERQVSDLVETLSGCW
jgi:hypothetical protein